RTYVAQNQERRRPSFPALSDIRAAGFLADRMQVQPPHQALQPLEVLTTRRTDLQPIRAVATQGLRRAVQDRQTRRSLRLDHTRVLARGGVTATAFSCKHPRLRSRTAIIPREGSVGNAGA